MKTEIPKNMQECINTKTGKKKLFPISQIKRGNLEGTDFRPITDKSVPYIEKANTKLDNSGKLVAGEKEKNDFEKFVTAQKDAKVLEQAKSKYSEAWQLELIDKQLEVLTAEPKTPATKTEK